MQRGSLNDATSALRLRLSDLWRGLPHNRGEWAHRNCARPPPHAKGREGFKLWNPVQIGMQPEAARSTHV